MRKSSKLMSLKISREYYTLIKYSISLSSLTFSSSKIFLFYTVIRLFWVHYKYILGAIYWQYIASLLAIITIGIFFIFKNINYLYSNILEYIAMQYIYIYIYIYIPNPATTDHPKHSIKQKSKIISYFPNF